MNHGLRTSAGAPITLFLGGDTMTGRGIDQVLARPSDPRLHESYVTDARSYVRLAMDVNGEFPIPVDDAALWGDALGEIDRHAPQARIVNLETSITTSEDWYRDKGIHYRMHPQNVGCLQAARLDVCTLANNHVLDWGQAGLQETLTTLMRAGLRTAGAGRDAAAARSPAVIDVEGGGRILVYAFGTGSCGIPDDWEAAAARPGIALLNDLSDATAASIGADIRRTRRAGDLAVISLHWGGNWGYAVSAEEVRFAHRLVDEGVDVLHGHSSHHPRPVELYRGKLILYGCGELIDDYEGIGGYERHRADLVLLYFPTLDPTTGSLLQLVMSPMRIRCLRLQSASRSEAAWLHTRMRHISAVFGSHIEATDDGRLLLRPHGPAFGEVARDGHVFNGR